ncbi:MAG: DNA internalization-related competence protein ComEC/Rec2 [bacterium]|nr:DNA internalization-related competence protein ComEC/Rec2 [bacterium]
MKLSVFRYPSHRSTLRGWVDELRIYIVATFDQHLSPDAAALGKALILGERRDFSPTFADRLRLTGLSHVFALSGMNVGFLLAIIWGISGLLCIPRVARLILLLPAVLIYMELGRAAPSLVRASLMAGFFVLANLLYRRNDVLNVVAGAALIELLWRPLDLLDAGFLLSYLAVIGILGGYGFIRELIVERIGQRRSAWIRGTVNLAAATTGAQIGTLPMVAFLFHRVPLLGAIGNLIAVPGFAVLLLWSVLLLVAESLVPSLTDTVAASMNALSFILATCVELFSVLPLASVTAPAFSPWLLALLYGAIGWLVIGTAQRRWRWIAGGALLTGALIVWAGFLGNREQSPEVSFISVGHGDAILLADRDHSILIDSGPSFGDWTAADRILSFLSERGIRGLDAMILTHADNDHMGGAADILNRIPVTEVFSNSDSSDTQTFVLTRMAARTHGVPWKTLSAGDRLIWSREISLTTLSPDGEIVDEMNESNRRSLVFKLECGGATALLTADIDSLTEKDLLPWGAVLDADLLKVAHHGSKSSSSGSFLNAVSPKLSIISSSATNRFHHPDSSVIARLHDIGSTVYSTATSGSLRFISRKGRWECAEAPARRLARQWKLGNDEAL